MRMNQTVKFQNSQTPVAVEGETSIPFDRQEILSLALTTARLFSQCDRSGANATIEKMLSVYVAQMRMPLAKDWSSLPSLEDVKKLMVEEYGSFEGISERQAEEFGRAVDSRIRQEFERHIPRLKEININPAVQLDTMQDCIGNIMLERDKKAEELSAAASGVLGRIRSRFMAQKGGDWNTNYLNSLPGETFANVVAHAGMSAVRRAASGTSHFDTAREITFLADLAEQHAGSTQYKTQSLVSDVRRKAAEVNVTYDRNAAFAR
jgi:hypothetical protein